VNRRPCNGAELAYRDGVESAGKVLLIGAALLAVAGLALVGLSRRPNLDLSA
jgi:hypothetical protein